MRRFRLATCALLLTAVAYGEPLTIQLTEQRADLKFGLNRPLLAFKADGTKMVAKRNDSKEIGEEQARRQDRNGVIASQLLLDLGLPSIPSYQARWQTGHGWTTGTASPWLDHALTLVEFPASRITNPDQAVAILIWREFLGDGDINATNLLVETQTGTLYAVDLDKAFMGIYPRKSSGFEEIMGLYANPARVEPILEKIRSLDREAIEAWLDRVGPVALAEWSPQLREEYVLSLLENREALIRANPYTRFYGSKTPPWLYPESLHPSQGDSRVRE